MVKLKTDNLKNNPFDEAEEQNKGKSVWDLAQPDYGMIVLPKDKLPGVWDYDKQLDQLLGDPEINIEDLLPLDVRYDFGRIVGMTEKPDETKDKLSNSLYYSIIFNTPPRINFNLLDKLNEIAVGAKMPASTAWGRIKDRYRGGKKQVQAMDYGFDLLNRTWKNWDAYEQSVKAIEKLQSGIKDDVRKDFRGFFEKTFGAAAEQIPMLWETIKESPAGALAGGFIGAAIAIAGGLTVPAPEEVITVPAATLKGAAVGAGVRGAIRIGQLEAGGMFLELALMEDSLGNKIDPKIAAIACYSVGTINGAIEMAEWVVLLSTFGIGTKLFEKSAAKVTSKLFAEGTLKNIVAKNVLKYGAALTAETLQEIEQETSTVVFGELAKELNNARKGTDFKPISAEDLKERYREVTIESLRAFGVILAPGTAVSTAIDISTRKPEVTKPTAEKKEIKAPEPTEEKFEAEVAEMDKELAEIQRQAMAETKPTEAKPAPEKPAEPITPEKAVEERPAEKVRASFNKYQKAMPNATEQEIVEALVADGLRPPKDMLKKYEDLPAVAEIIEQDRIDQIIKRRAKPEAVEVAPEAKKELISEEKQLRDEINRNMGDAINTLFKIWPTIGKELGLSRNELVDRGAAFVFDTISDVRKGLRAKGRRDVSNQFDAVEGEHIRLSAQLDINQAKLLEIEAQPVAKAEPTKVEVKPAELIEAKSKLRQKIQVVAALKGLTKKALSELKMKHTGYRNIEGKISERKISTEQLENLLKAITKTRPKQIGYKRVITKKTEKKIQSLKENLIKKTQMTEGHFDEILEIEIHGREPKYIDAKNFITETQGKDILRRMLDTAEIVRLTESFEQAIAKNPEIAERIKLLDSRIEKAPKRDPYSLESMRYYNQQAQIKTGSPIFTSYMDLMDTHLEITKTRTATLKRLQSTTSKFKDIAKDKEALQRVSDYIASQSKLKEKPAMPKDITADEIKLAKGIQEILEEYRLKVRVTKFYNWYYYNQPIPDQDRYTKEITKAVDIYESKGREELIEYLGTQEWGVIKSGYEPLEILFHKIRPYTTGPTAVGKGHIKIRTDIEYHKQERNILQRLTAYMRQIDMLYNLSPKINAYIRLFDDNASKFSDWGKVKGDIEIFLRNLKRYNIEGGFFERMIARAYSQAMRVIIMPSPVLAYRNLHQNLSFETDKSILIDPRNTNLSSSDIEYLETYILQTRAMVEEYFMVGEKPLPGLKFLTKLIDKVKIYPWSDIANRHWSFWAKTNQVERALTAESVKQMMTEAKFEDMKELEQRRALAILARDGKEAMTQYIGRVHVDDIHFLYERSQRSPAEMTSLGKIVGNLMLFPRAYGEKLAHAANKMLKGKTYEEQWRGLKTIFAVVGGGMIVGSLYTKVTGRKRNPYDPLEILTFRPGGLAWGSIEAVTEIYANILSATKGDSRALATLTVAIPRAADMFIPFYDYTLRAIEAATDQKNIDRKALRQMRMMIDKEYKIRGGAYKVKRNALEKWQYFIAGAGVDYKEKEPKDFGGAKK